MKRVSTTLILASSHHRFSTWAYVSRLPLRLGRFYGSFQFPAARFPRRQLALMAKHKDGMREGFVAVHQRDAGFVAIELFLRPGAKPVTLRRASAEKVGQCLARLSLKIWGQDAASTAALSLVAYS